LKKPDGITFFWISRSCLQSEGVEAVHFPHRYKQGRLQNKSQE